MRLKGLIKSNFINGISATLLIISPIITLPSHAAEGYWLDQYSALLYMASFNLDSQFSEMKRRGAHTIMVHADSLPRPILRFIAWRAKVSAGLESIAWIQRPNQTNLKRAGSLNGYKGVQIDDHFFNNPPLSMSQMRDKIGSKELWCSFQPNQYSYKNARQCDHIDVQIYRRRCRETGDYAYNLGATGRKNTAVAVYHDGSSNADIELKCMESDLRSLGSEIFVFKWNNPEAFINYILKQIKSIF